MKPARRSLAHLTATERQAAAMICMALDFPACSDAFTGAIAEAVRFAPDMTTADMPSGEWSKRRALERARELVDQAIRELP